LLNLYVGGVLVLRLLHKGAGLGHVIQRGVQRFLLGYLVIRGVAASGKRPEAHRRSGDGLHLN
jgi:hypothetical protein